MAADSQHTTAGAGRTTAERNGAAGERSMSMRVRIFVIESATSSATERSRHSRTWSSVVTRRTLVATARPTRHNGVSAVDSATHLGPRVHRTAAGNRPPSARTLSVADAARLLGISRSLAYECVRRGELPSIRLGTRIVVPASAIDEILSRATNGEPIAHLAG